MRENFPALLRAKSAASLGLVELVCAAKQNMSASSGALARALKEVAHTAVLKAERMALRLRE